MEFKCTAEHYSDQNGTIYSTSLENGEKERVQISATDYEIVRTEVQNIKALGKRVLSSYTRTEISNLPTNKKMLYRATIPPTIKENQVLPTVEKIISDITSKDKDIDEISLLLYSDKELANGVYDVARATWAPNGELGNVTPKIVRTNNRNTYKISLQIKENLEEYLQKRLRDSGEKFGFSEDKRKQLFKTFVALERRARNEADARYPLGNRGISLTDIENNVDLSNKLLEKYGGKARQKYGITKDQKRKIMLEAIEKHWPQ